MVAGVGVCVDGLVVEDEKMQIDRREKQNSGERERCGRGWN